MEGRPIQPNHQFLDLTSSPTLLGLYTQLCLCYDLPDPSSHTQIVEKLEAGLEKLSASFPWIAGGVAWKDGVRKMQPLRTSPCLVVKDFTNDSSMPTMEQYRTAKFPFSMLDESVICPVNTLPNPLAPESVPIFLVQANFIVGGLLLTFSGEHSTMDMIGQAQVISLLSKACKDEGYTEQELLGGNIDRREIFKLLDKYERGPELDHQIKKSAQPSVVPGLGLEDQIAEDAPELSNTPPEEVIWAYFDFSDRALADLKRQISQSLTSGYVSTDDSVSALVWQSVARARLKRLSPETKSTFARAVDARRFLGVSKTYQGLLTNMTYHTHSLEKLVQTPVALIASEFRYAVDPKTTQLEYNTRAFATAFVQADDKSIFGPVINQQPDRDIALSSWANINSYSLDFGLRLGKPESVRRPRFAPVESLIYLMPRNAKGDSAAAICLRKEDMDALKADSEFLRYATYVG